MKPSPAHLGRHGLPRCLVQPIQECCCKGVHPPAEWSRQRDGTREQLDHGNMKSMGFQQVTVQVSRRKKPWIPGCSIDSVVRKCLLEGRRTVARLPAPPPNQSTTITEEAPYIDNHWCGFRIQGSTALENTASKRPAGSSEPIKWRASACSAGSPCRRVASTKPASRSTPNTVQPQAAMWGVSVPSPQPRSSTRCPGRRPKSLIKSQPSSGT